MMNTNLHGPETDTYLSAESMGMMNMPYGQTVQPMNMNLGQTQNKMGAPMYPQMRSAQGMGAGQPSSITLTSPYPATSQMHHVPHPHAHARHRHSQINYQGLYAQLNPPMQPRSDEYNGGGS